MLLLGQLSAAEKPAVTIWKFDQTGQVGGHATRILGAPQVVEDATGKAVHFNGASDGLLVPVNPLAGLSQFTIEALICPDAVGPEEQRFFHFQDETGNRGLLELRLTDKGWALDTFLRSEKNKIQLTLLDRTKLHPAGRWTWVSMVYENGHMTHYIDGVKELEGDIAFTPMSAGQSSLGVRQTLVSWYKGSIRELRFHSVALERKALQQAK